MTKISRLALAAMLALGAGGALTAAPAVAKDKPAAAPSVKLTKAVQVNLAEAQKLQGATPPDLPGALAKIQAADAAKVTPDDAYTVNLVKLNQSIIAKDNALMEQALEGALASGKVAPEEQVKFLRNLGALALQRKDTPGAIKQYERLSQIAPNDGDAIISLAELYQTNNQTQQATATIARAVAAKKAAGQPVPEAWYRRALGISYDSKLKAESSSAGQALVQAYPNPVNWRDALTIFRDLNNPDDPTTLDTFRLARMTGALNGERDYGSYAEMAVQAGLSTEADGVFKEGVSKNMLSPGKPYLKDLQAAIGTKVKANVGTNASLEKEARGPKATGKLAAAAADGYLASGDNAKAAELYQLALDKQVADKDSANMRKGIALTRAGKKAEAEAAFKAVAPGTLRGQLAQYWLAYLNQKA